MWRTSRDVHISYSPLPAHTSSKSNNAPLERNADRVEHTPISADGGDKLSLCERLRAAPRVIEGTNTATRAGDASCWDWRGKGALFFVTAHWEVLGWGERSLGDGTERWLVTWFQKTLFSEEGVDIYCDRAEGLSEETYGLIFDALKRIEAKHVVDLVDRDLFKIKIKSQDED